VPLSGDARRLVDFVVRTMAEALYAISANEASLAYFDEDEDFDGGDYLPVGGYRGFVDVLATRLDVRLGEAVTSVSYDANGVTVTTNAGPHTGSHVVVTVPLGVLEAGGIAFSPALPSWKTNALAALSMGDAEKVVLRFDQAFWPSGQRGFLYASTTPGEYPLIFDMTPFAGAPILVSLVSGQFARDLAGMSESVIRQRVLAILSEMVGSSAPQPTHFEVSRWGSDPFSLGGYPAIPVGGSLGNIATLGDPVGGRVLFAGDGTFAAYYGSAHGAMLSGIREAKRLLTRPTVFIPEPRPWLLQGAAGVSIAALAWLARRRRGGSSGSAAGSSS